MNQKISNTFELLKIIAQVTNPVVQLAMVIVIIIYLTLPPNQAKIEVQLVTAINAQMELLRGQIQETLEIHREIVKQHESIKDEIIRTREIQVAMLETMKRDLLERQSEHRTILNQVLK